MNDLIQKIEQRQATVGVIGQGYVGLPLALVFAEAGLQAIGFDVDPRKVAAVGEGRSHIEDVTSEELAPLVEKQESNYNYIEDLFGFD